MKTLSEIPDEFDVIIDDGPHTLISQKFFIANYCKKLSPNGIMFLEDIQALHWLDKLILAAPRNFKGCMRVVDLRTLTGIGDALVLIMHKHVSRSCNLNIKAKNHNRFLSRIASMMRLRKIKYNINRTGSKFSWKLKKSRILSKRPRN